MPIKSYQFFKIYKRFFQKREKKTLIQQSMRKAKLRKVGHCFITGFIIKPFKMTVNHFIFSSIVFLFNRFFLLFRKLVRSAIFAVWYKDDARDIKRRNWELGMTNYNIYFKNNLNRSVMNVTQINFLYLQNVHVWHLIKVNHKRSL